MREYLKKLRKEKGYTMQVTADKLGISKQYYQSIEVGKRQQNMDITLAVKLSDIFGISIQTLIEEEQAIKKLA